jgi:beta-phosphoglucomutase-like phosphatase (HAD superfamily)
MRSFPYLFSPQISSASLANPSIRPGWAIVTSATAPYGHVGFAASLSSPSPPRTFITSDQVSRGKPAPDPYLLGAEQSGADPKRCLVVEDAPPGVLAGKAAGCRVLGLKTTHDVGRMWEAGADFVCQDLSGVSARWEGEKLIITIQGEEKQ